MPNKKLFIQKIWRKKETLCIQSHLAEGTISVFSDIDTLVTFGNEKDTLKKLKLLVEK